MGNSLPPPASFDLVDSVARTRDGDVELVLANPTIDDLASPPVLVLKQGKRTLEAAGALVGEPDERRLTVRAPRARVTDGIWSIAAKTASGGQQPIQARLLVQANRPLVLLWGAKTPDRTEPEPRTGVRHAAASAGVALDRVLSVLPPDKAVGLGERARRAARAVIR